MSAVLIDHEKITAVGTQSGFYGVLHSETGIDVGNDLTAALRGIGAYTREAIVSARRANGQIDMNWQSSAADI